GFDALNLLAEMAPCLAVVDNAVHPRPQLRIHWIVKFTLPPKIEWKIGIKLGKNDVRQQSRGRSFQQERKLFGTNLFAARPTDVAMRADPRLHAIFFLAGIRANDDCAAGVVLR